MSVASPPPRWHTWLLSLLATALLVPSLLAAIASLTGLGADHDGAWFSPRRTGDEVSFHEGYLGVAVNRWERFVDGPLFALIVVACALLAVAGWWLERRRPWRVDPFAWLASAGFVVVGCWLAWRADVAYNTVDLEPWPDVLLARPTYARIARPLFAATALFGFVALWRIARARDVRRGLGLAVAGTVLSLNALSWVEWVYFVLPARPVTVGALEIDLPRTSAPAFFIDESHLRVEVVRTEEGELRVRLARHDEARGDDPVLYDGPIRSGSDPSARPPWSDALDRAATAADREPLFEGDSELVIAEPVAFAVDRSLRYGDVRGLLQWIVARGYWRLQFVTDGGGAPGARGVVLVWQPKNTPTEPGGLELELATSEEELVVIHEGDPHELSSAPRQRKKWLAASEYDFMTLRIADEVTWGSVVAAASLLEVESFAFD